MSSLVFFPTSPKEALVKEFVGKSIRDVPTPAAVMNKLELGWRAHVKTHKTVELTRLQVGEDVTRPANLIISTLSEAEFILPLLEEYKSKGRQVNFVYGLPISKGAVPRLAAIAKVLGEGSISVLLDDPAQLAAAAELEKQSGVKPLAHIKIDMGGKRAGVVESSERFVQVAEAALAAHKAGAVVLSGLYSHAGHSYGGDSRVAAVKMLRAEVDAMLSGADRLAAKAKETGVTLPTLVVSAGASPTALAAAVTELAELFRTVKSKGHAVEIHAGVYPTLDLQQLAAHSMASSKLSWRDIALTIVAEVHGVYPGRGTNGTDEALIGAGGLALGREFCKAYDGMAMVTPWGRNVPMPSCDVEDYEGWTVGRFAQEHGILTWAAGKRKTEKGLGPQGDAVEAGQLLRLWPNHACITSSHFGWYFVVDEDNAGHEDEIVDVWIKARGW
ncbi:putative serine dehydratase domain-containing protein [Trichoderma breve]|uniref:Serine dehydratase domain-containing protein n=1 Tax=Trichoderma breve TaxID=2034170 RepID=A0A9W9E9N0_9HYPO|nr:putative serine dehydratase domain-containing protein [Trichoderma breve]KAJ4862102.1 putative serine dehydratase domain-containing protein [Trichoderma breve]